MHHVPLTLAASGPIAVGLIAVGLIAVGLLAACSDRIAPEGAPVAPITAPPVTAAPITAPPAAPSAPRPATSIVMVEIAAQVGLHHIHDSGARGELLYPETNSGGGGFFDPDLDGDPDILLLNGAPHAADGGPISSVHFYENLGRPGAPRFENRTAPVGLTQRGDVQTYAAADFDHDGDVDLAVAGYEVLRLYRNDGDLHFTDVTHAAGLDAFHGFASTLAWIDARRDGYPDLLVGRYGIWTPEIDRRLDCRRADGQRIYCGPRSLEPAHAAFYRNDAGRFRDATAEAGLAEVRTRALGVAVVDFDGDGWLDAFIANDALGNLLLESQRDGTFRERGLAYGVAGRELTVLGGMGVSVADFAGDGRMCIAVGNFAGEPVTLHCQAASPTGGWQSRFYEEVSAPTGVGAPAFKHVTFGLAFADLDLDGLPELLVANGHVVDVEATQGEPMAQPLQVLAPVPGVHARGAAQGLPVWAEVSPPGGLAGVRAVGRALATADVDGDGDLDALLVANGGPVRLLRNDTPPRGRSLRLRLAGGPGAPDGLGASVTVELGPVRRRDFVLSGGSYGGESDHVLTFGVPEAGGVTAAEVRWGGGQRERFELPAGAGAATLVRGAGRAVSGPASATPRDEPFDLPSLATLPLSDGKALAAARDRLEKALAQNPGHSELAIALARLQAASTGSLSEAIASLEAVRHRRPDLLSVRLELALLFWHAGRPAQAESEVRAIIGQVSGEGYLLTRLAVPLMDAGAHGLAELAVDAVLRQAPNRPQALVLKAGVHLAAEDLVGAERYALLALAQSPKHAAALTTLGYIDLHRRAFPEAAARFEAALVVRRSGEESANAKNGLAMTREAAGRKAEAAALYLEAGATVADPGVSFRAAELFWALGDTEQARQALIRCQAVAPDFAPALLLLASVEEKGGRIERALALCQKARATAAQVPDADACLQRLSARPGPR